jgi:SAM-dependent methyltransferase
VTAEPTYLAPYLDAARRHAGGFYSLLWASPNTQAARFDAICRLSNLNNKSLLDLGCGHADLLDYLLSRNITPADYIGIEAVPQFIDISQAKKHRNAKIIQADFLDRPACMFVGADVIAISGTLNTLSAEAFYSTIRRAFDATAEQIVFNFLCKSSLAAASYLTWHQLDDVSRFAHSLSGNVQILSDYLDGDCTIAITKEQAHP